MMFEKYGQHQPLNRQAEQYAREGVELSLSTLADHVGGCAAVLWPIYDLICAHAFAGSRNHGDDTRQCRFWPTQPRRRHDSAGFGQR